MNGIFMLYYPINGMNNAIKERMMRNFVRSGKDMVSEAELLRGMKVKGNRKAIERILRKNFQEEEVDLGREWIE